MTAHTLIQRASIVRVTTHRLATAIRNRANRKADRIVRDGIGMADRNVRPPFRGFTLIELLIVIAIIAILALIAVPNFLEAQTRAKVSRSEADMRSLATGLEAYAVEWSVYPIVPPYPDGGWDDPRAWLAPLTTPIAFVTRLPQYPWVPVRTRIGGNWIELDYYDYKSRYSWEIGFRQWGGQPWCVWDPLNTHRWALYAVGPDKQINYHPGVWDWPSPPEANACGANYLLYDPSNGTVSDGDLVRVGP